MNCSQGSTPDFDFDPDAEFEDGEILGSPVSQSGWIDIYFANFLNIHVCSEIHSLFMH